MHKIIAICACQRSLPAANSLQADVPAILLAQRIASPLLQEKKN